MVQRTQILLEDDISGGPADETVQFGLNNAQYEIDLNSDHAQELRAAFELFVAHGRKLTGVGRVRRGQGAAMRARSAEIRAWARANGFDVSDRGRISSDIVAKWESER